MIDHYWLAPSQGHGAQDFSRPGKTQSRRSSRRNKKFVIQLTPTQREELDRIVGSRSCSHRDHVRATAMLLADESNPKGAKTDEEIALLTRLSVRTIETLRRRFVEQGLPAAVSWRRLTRGEPPSI